MYIKQNQNQCAYIGVKGKNRGIRCQTKCKYKFCSKHKPRVPVSSSMPSTTAPVETVPETITKAPDAYEVPGTDVHGSSSIPSTTVLEAPETPNYIKDDLPSCLVWPDTDDGIIKIDLDILKKRVEIQKTNWELKRDI